MEKSFSYQHRNLLCFLTLQEVQQVTTGSSAAQIGFPQWTFKIQATCTS